MITATTTEIEKIMFSKTMTGGYTMKEKNIRELAKRMGLITVEDMCQYTIAQLVVKIANKVNELVNEVWRFESDVQEILKTQNENIQYLLGEGLHLELENIFDGWVKDGTFDILINQTALKKVNERIDETNAQLSEIKIEKADNVKVDNVQQQLNNLVLGAVGDGNNAEIIQARVDKSGSTFSTLKDNLDNIKSAIEDGTEKYHFGGWEQGSISSGGNNDTEDAKRLRIRTKNIVIPVIIPLFKGSFIANILSDYSVEFIFYSDSNFTNMIFATGWVTETYHVPKKSEYFRIVAKRNDGGTINSDEGNGIISIDYNSKSYLINDEAVTKRTTYSSNKLESTMIDIYGTHSKTEKEDDRHIIRIKDLENSFNLKDISITDNGGLVPVIVDNSMWGGLYTSKSIIKLEFAINNNGWILFEKNDKKYHMMPLLGSMKGYKYTITEGTLDVSVSDAPMVIPGSLWQTANNSTIFTLKKVANVLEIYMGEGVGSSLIATINDCNILGFLTSSTFNMVLTGCYATTQVNKILTKGLYQKVYDLEEKIQTGSSTTLDSRFKNMKAICSGDSITEKNFRATVNWVDYIKNWCGFEICTNDGKSGTGLVRPNGEYKCLIDRIDEWDTGYDMILIMGNMNDYSDASYFNESKLGVMGDKTKDTQYGAIDVTINKLLNKYPNASIGWIISTPRQYLEKYGSSSTVAQDGYLWGNTSAFDKASQAIKEVCGKYSIPVLDLYHESGLRPWNETNRAEYFSCTQSPDGDGVHPNEKGQQKIAYKIYEFIKQYM